MSVARQLPLPILPQDVPSGLRNYLNTMASNLRAWIADSATHLGQFQDTPSAYKIPNANEVLTFDGSYWTPAAGGAVLSTSIAPWEPLVGPRNGVNTSFTIAAGLVALGVNGNPIASVLQGGAPIPYTSGAPGPFQWTLSGQTFILGTPPTGAPTDEPIVAFVLLQ